MIVQLILAKTPKGFAVARQLLHGDVVTMHFPTGQKGQYLFRAFATKDEARQYAQRMEGTGLDQITWQITDLLG